MSRYDCMLEFPAKSPLHGQGVEGGGEARSELCGGIIALRHEIQGIIICISVAIQFQCQGREVGKTVKLKSARQEW